MPKDFSPSDISNAQTICALRFRGYEYEQQLPNLDRSVGSGLAGLAQPIIQTLTLYTNQNHNFAVFFGLQRFLGKWGGEMLPETSKEHIAYDFLFLHLYHLDPPELFRHDDYDQQWQQEFAPYAEAIAAEVRRTLITYALERSPSNQHEGI